MRSNCSSPAGGVRSPASPTTPFTRTWPRRRINLRPGLLWRAHGARHHQQARRREPASRGAIRRSAGAGAAARMLTCCPCPRPEEVRLNAAGRRRLLRSTDTFDSTARLTAADRAAAVAQMVDVAKKHALTAAGIYSHPLKAFEGIFNSRGVADWYEQTLAEVSITMIGDTSSGWQKANSPDATLLDPCGLAEIAAQKAIASRNPARASAGQVHGDSRAGCCARRRWIYVLGFRRLGPAGAAFVPE